MRANRKLPPCDWWDFKVTYADFLAQGLTGLLYFDNTDWDSKTKEELEFIIDWAIEFPYLEYGIIANDAEDWALLKKQFSGTDVCILTKEQYQEFEKRTVKAMRLLAKNIHKLWD